MAQVRAFVEGNEPVSFTLADRTTAHAWMTDTLKRFRFAHCARADKGVLRRYLANLTGLGRSAPVGSAAVTDPHPRWGSPSC
jgi:hypothetical protein